MKNALFTICPKTADSISVTFKLDGKSIGERTHPNEELTNWTAEIEKQYATCDGPAGITPLTKPGALLADWLDGPTNRWIEQSINNNSHGLAIHIHVHSFRETNTELEKRLRHLPWEILHYKGAFLAARKDTLITPVRRVTEARLEVSTANRPLRILFMACSPVDVEPELDFEKEETMILDATSHRPIELVVEESGSLNGLRKKIEDYGKDYFDVLHLTGHAGMEKGRPFFVMENDFGRRDPADAEEIAKAFSHIWPRIVFLSGCKTGAAPEEGTLPSMCESLVSAGAPTVIGWALPVNDESASLAASELYYHLAAARRIDDAAAFTRQKLLDEGLKDWRLLQLYSDATPFEAPVTPLNTKGRTVLKTREAQIEFLDAGSKSEVCARKDFVGRRRLIQRCLRVLNSTQNEEEYAEGVLLHGMGGLGKSSLAARLCERMTVHERLVCVGRFTEETFLSFFKDRLQDEEFIKLLEREDLPLKNKLKICLTGPFSEKPALFVFDDFEINVELDSQENPVVNAEPLEVLSALASAVRETASRCRILVTCCYDFDIFGPARLHKEMLYSMAGSELKKKEEMLDGFKKLRDSADEDDRSLHDRALAAAGGNPRLLGRINKLLTVPDLDHADILSRVEQKLEEFREETLLSELLRCLPPAGRRLLGLLAVFDLPVPIEAVKAAADPEAFDAFDRAAALGLAERVHRDTENVDYCFVSRVLTPLVEGELSEEMKAEACRTGAEALYKTWFHNARAYEFQKLMEIYRIAVLGEKSEIAVEMCVQLSSILISCNLYREALPICSSTLNLVEDYRVLLNAARAEEVLGYTHEARSHYERSLELCPESSPSTPTKVRRDRSAILSNFAGLLAQTGEINSAMNMWDESLKLKDQIGDVKGKAATFHNMAGVIAQQGDIPRAMKLWDESLKILDQIGDVEGRAATLGNMAYYIAGQGDISRAMNLWDESLKILDQIGDVRGKAATLANMAWVENKKGNTARGHELNLKAANLLGKIGAFMDLATVLTNLGAGKGSDPKFLAQALWLNLRIPIPLENALNLSAGLIKKIGLDSETALMTASAMPFFVQMRGENHPNKKELLDASVSLLGTCAKARGITQEGFMDWFKSSKLNDPSFFIPALNEQLEKIVGEDNWLFDRNVFPPL